MLEDLVKIMMEQWNLPEESVRSFLKESFQNEGSDLALEDLREQTASLLQDMILKPHSDE
jgi:hypothetical protein